jgi:VWFA-related protein
MKICGGIVLGMMLASAGLACADPSPATMEGNRRDVPAFRVSVGLVQVDAVVTDKQGRLVTDLRPEDFTVLENGKPQEIANLAFVDAGTFASSAEDGSIPHRHAPRTIVFLFDDLGLSFFGSAAARSALQKFASEPFAPGDHVALVRTSMDAGTYTFYGSNQELAAAVTELRYDLRSNRGEGPAGTLLTAAMRQDSFARRIAVLVGTIDGLRWLPGRKAVVLLSEGFYLSNEEFYRHGLHTAYDALFSDPDELATTRTVTEVANRASVVLYAIDPRGLGGDYWLSQGTLSDLAESTGGLAVLNRNNLLAGLRSVVADQAGYYLIGYEPPPSTFQKKSGHPKFQSVKVKLNRPDLKIRFRSGFYGLTDTEVAMRAPTPN